MRLERRGSEAGVGTEAGAGGSWAEAEDTGFWGGRGHRLRAGGRCMPAKEARERGPRERHVHEIHVYEIHAYEMDAHEMHAHKMHAPALPTPRATPE